MQTMGNGFLLTQCPVGKENSTLFGNAGVGIQKINLNTVFFFGSVLLKEPRQTEKINGSVAQPVVRPGFINYRNFFRIRPVEGTEAQRE